MSFTRIIYSDNAPIDEIREGNKIIQKRREANPVLTISAVLDKANVCVLLRASYIGKVNNDDQPGFEVSTKLSDRQEIIARTRQEITTDGMYFATDCGSSGVQALVGNVIFQAFYTALGIGKIWGNPVGVVIPADFWTAPLQVNFYPDLSDQFDPNITLEGDDITANSGTIYAQVRFGRQPLRSIGLTISIQAFPDRFSPGTTKNFTFNVTNAERNSEGIFKHTITDSIFALNLGIITANLSATDNAGTTERARQRYSWDKSNFLQINPSSITVNGGIGEKGVYTLRLANVVVEEEDIILSDSSWVSLTYDKDNRTFTLTTTSFNLSNDSRSIIISITKSGLSASATFTQESGQSLTRPTISFVGSRSQTITKASGQSKDYELQISNPDGIAIDLMLTGPQLTLDTANQRWNIADWGHASIVNENNKTLVRATSITENTGNQRQTTFQAGLIFNFIGGRTTALTQQATFIQQTGILLPTIRTEPVVITIDDDIVDAQTYEVIVTNADVSDVVLGSIEDWVTATISGTTLTITPKSVNPSSSNRRVANIELTITNSSGSATTQAFLVQRPAPEPTTTAPVIGNISNISLNRVHPNSRSVAVSINDGGETATKTLSKVSGTSFFNVAFNSSTNTITASTKNTNNDFTERREQYRLTATNSIGSDTELFTIIQAPNTRTTTPTISVNPSTRQIISSEAGSSHTFSITITNGSISDAFVRVANVPSWISPTPTIDTTNSQITITAIANTGAQRDADIEIALPGASSAFARIRQRARTSTSHAPIIKHLNPSNGLIQRNNNLSFSGTFTISIDALPTTITEHQFDDLSAGAWSSISYSSGTITADISINNNPRQRNTAVRIRLRNSTGWGNWLRLEVRQPRKPIEPPSINSLSPPNIVIGASAADSGIINVDYDDGGGDTTGAIAYVSGVQNVFFVSYSDTLRRINISAFVTNTSSSSRTARFRLTLTNSAGSDSRTFNIQQDHIDAPPKTISITPTARQSIAQTGGSQIFAITVGGTTINDVSVTPSSVPSWVSPFPTIDTTNNQITITATANTGSETRTADIRLTLTTGQSAIARISQVGLPEEELAPFIEVDPEIINVAYNDTSRKQSSITLQNAQANDITIGTIPSWLTVRRENLIVFLQPLINNQRNNQQRAADIVLTATTNNGSHEAIITFVQRGRPCENPTITNIRPRTINVGRSRGNTGTARVDFTDGNCNAVAIFSSISGVGSRFSLEFNNGLLTATANQTNNNTTTITNVYALSLRNAAGLSAPGQFTVVQLSRDLQVSISLSPSTSLSSPRSVSVSSQTITFTISVSDASINNAGITPASVPSWIDASISTARSQLVLVIDENTIASVRTAQIRVFVNAGGNPSTVAYISQAAARERPLSVSPMVWTPSGLSQSQDFTITGASSIPTITESVSWLSISNKTISSFTGNVTINEGDERNAKITIRETVTRSVEVTVRQSELVIPEVTLDPGSRSITFLPNQSQSFTYEIANPNLVTILGITLISDDVDSDTSIGGWSNSWVQVILSGNSRRGTINCSVQSINTGPTRTIAFQVRISFSEGTHTSSEGIFSQGLFIPITASPSSWTPNNAAQSQTFTLNIGPRSRNAISIVDSATWISTPSGIDANLRFTAFVMENTTPNERIGTIGIQSNIIGDGQRGIPVTQASALLPTISISPTSRTIDYDDTSTQLFKITITDAGFDDLSIVDTVPRPWNSWFLSNRSDGIFIVANNIMINNTPEQRIDAVSVQVTTEVGSDTESLLLTQRAAPFPTISVTPTSRTIAYDETTPNTYYVTLTNAVFDDVSIIYTGIENWVLWRFDYDEETIEAVATENPLSSIRTSEVIISVSNLLGSARTGLIAVKQLAAPELIVTPREWSPTYLASTFTFQITGTRASDATISEDPEVNWLNLSSINSNGQFTASITENTTFLERTTRIVVFVSRILTIRIQVRQERKPI